MIDYAKNQPPPRAANTVEIPMTARGPRSSGLSTAAGLPLLDGLALLEEPEPELELELELEPVGSVTMPVATPLTIGMVVASAAISMTLLLVDSKLVWPMATRLFFRSYTR